MTDDIFLHDKDREEKAELSVKRMAGREPADEMTPRGGRPVPQDPTGGEQADRAGELGEMAPESAQGLRRGPAAGYHRDPAHEE